MHTDSILTQLVVQALRCFMTPMNNAFAIYNNLKPATCITHTHIHTQPFYDSLDSLRDNLGKPVPEETFTHSHLSWSSLIPYLQPQSIMIHGIFPVQSTCLTVVFHNLSPSFLWSTSWPSTLNFILHTFLHPIIVFFSQHMPIPLQPILL